MDPDTPKSGGKDVGIVGVVAFLGFAVSITLLSVLMTWVYNDTNGSLLPALLMHTSWNWAQGMFPVLESDPASLAMVGLLVIATVLVVVDVRRDRPHG
jgi:hypothetical protein